MKNKLSLTPILFIAFSVMSTSCSDDNENKAKYNSAPPTFSNMKVADLETGSTVLKAGNKIVVTLEQSSKGKLLNKTTYNWSLNPDLEGNSHKYKTSVIYDQETENPTDTILINTAGTYTITFTAKYNASAFTTIWQNSGAANNNTYWPDNSGKVSYELSGIGGLGFKVKATKKIVVNE